MPISRVLLYSILGCLSLASPTGALAQAHLVGHWTGDGTTDDQSGNALHGILVGGATSDGVGIYGEAFSIPLYGYVAVDDDPLLDLTSSLTLAAWVRPASIDGFMTFLNKEEAYELGINRMGQVCWALRMSSWWGWNCTSAIATVDEWSHVALTFDAGEATLYVDGQLVDRRTHQETAVTASAEELRIGYRILFDEPFDGLIDDVQIYDAALTAGDIATVQAGGTVGACADLDADGICDEGDLCEGDDASGDTDADGICDDIDNCPSFADSLDQADTDADGLGDVCDLCPTVFDPDQPDSDGDGIGDACELDWDEDGIDDDDDNCPDDSNLDQADSDGDGLGDVCDDDDDDDGVPDSDDNCPVIPNADQADVDLDGQGDECDDDADGDGILDGDDACPDTPLDKPTTTHGCSGKQFADLQCPIDGIYNSRADYVCCVAGAASAGVEVGLLSSRAAAVMKRRAARYDFDE